MPYVKPIIWTLAEALYLIKDIQSALKPLGYHVVLGGGVLNRGWSQKDLDLYFIPLTNDKQPDLAPLVNHLLTIFRQSDSDDASHRPNPYSPFRLQFEWTHKGRRVDAFIV
jgi:hypothetical protein